MCQGFSQRVTSFADTLHSIFGSKGSQSPKGGQLQASCKYQELATERSLLSVIRSTSLGPKDLVSTQYQLAEWGPYLFDLPVCETGDRNMSVKGTDTLINSFAIWAATPTLHLSSIIGCDANCTISELDTIRVMFKDHMQIGRQSIWEGSFTVKALRNTNEHSRHNGKGAKNGGKELFKALYTCNSQMKLI